MTIKSLIKYSTANPSPGDHLETLLAANGEGVVLKFWTFPDGGRGWFVKVRTSENFLYARYLCSRDALGLKTER